MYEQDAFKKNVIVYSFDIVSKIKILEIEKNGQKLLLYEGSLISSEPDLVPI